MTASLPFIEPLLNLPEEFDGYLDCNSLAICCMFNRRGSLLAVGCNDGRIAIWDFLTRGIAKIILAHTNHPVCSVSWSRNGRKLVSASLDNTIAVWEVLTAECLMRWRFPSPILKAQFNPRNDKLVLVCPLKHAPVLIDIDYEQSSIKYRILPTDKEDADANITATFDRRGQYIYTGNAKGKIVIIRCPKTLSVDMDPQIVSSFRLQCSGTSPAIREIEFGARNKKHFLVNSSDRAIRMFDCNSALNAGVNGTCQEVKKFQEQIEKNAWRRCCLPGGLDSPYACGVTAKQQELCIWDTETGDLAKKLEINKAEVLLDLQWHPLRPIIVFISGGLVSVWARPQIENWSAFAPDFKELEENMEYDERESEFDLEDEDNRPGINKVTDVDESEEVDVLEVRPEVDLLSSDEEEENPDNLEFIPIAFEDVMIEQDVNLQLQDANALNQQKKGPKKTIDVTLDNPPINEQHPLSQSSSKRIRSNDKSNNPRKVARHT